MVWELSELLLNNVWAFSEQQSDFLLNSIWDLYERVPKFMTKSEISKIRVIRWIQIKFSHSYPCHAEWIKMAHPLLIVNQSDYSI